MGIHGEWGYSESFRELMMCPENLCFCPGYLHGFRFGVGAVGVQLLGVPRAALSRYSIELSCLNQQMTPVDETEAVTPHTARALLFIPLLPCVVAEVASSRSLCCVMCANRHKMDKVTIRSRAVDTQI